MSPGCPAPACQNLAGSSRFLAKKREVSAKKGRVSLTAWTDVKAFKMDACRHAVVARADLPCLFEALKTLGYCLVGPTVRDGAIIYDQIETVDELPAGWMDRQDGIG
jgi:hypothetical protein